MSEDLRYTVYVVPHTHWDRAWYSPFAEFHLKLVRMVDRLIAQMEADPAFPAFCLDGQTVVLEDYFAIRPHMADRLKKLVQQRRVWVGPWYVLPDEFLVSAESLVRNLLIGTRIAGEMGHSMRVGYEPDAFGHIAQLPQILRGFGLDTFLASRGIDWDTSDVNVEFTWSAPDGSSVLALMQKDGYTNMSRWGLHGGWGDTDRWIVLPDLALQQFQTACDKLKPSMASSVILLNDGVDHAEHQSHLPELLRLAQERFPEYAIRAGSFEEYVEAAKRDVAEKPLKTAMGELDSPYGPSLRGTNSARMYLKTANQHCEDLLERYAEPLSALAWFTGSDAYPADTLDYIWRTLLKNHPHDDICGCSVDQVHRDMEHRFEQVAMMGQVVEREAVRALARNVDHSVQSGVPILVFNPLGTRRNEVVTVPIDLVRTKELWDTIALFDEDGQPVAFDLVSCEDVDWMEPVKWYAARRFTVRLLLDLPPCGCRTLYVREGAGVASETQIQVAARTFENMFYRVNIENNGSLTVFDKETETLYRDLLVFEDMEDAGDEYSWSYLRESSAPVTTATARPEIEIVYQGALSATWRITHQLPVPESLTADRTARSQQKVALEIVSEVTCRAHSPRVDIETRVRNNAKDHRLRALFPTPIRTDRVHVDAHYAIVERPVRLAPPKGDLPPYPTQHVQRFAVLSDDARQFAIINDGLPEFEPIECQDGVTLAQTLYRSCGWLAHEGFALRPLLAGPPLETPEAQCLREMTFRYGFALGKPDLGAVVREAQQHNLDVLATRCDIDFSSDLQQYPPCRAPYFAEPELVWNQPKTPIPRDGALPDRCSLIDMGNDRLVLSAVKKCETRDTLIVRVYNPSNETCRGILRFHRPIREAWATLLNEERQETLRVIEGTIAFDCPAYKVKTIEIAR